MPSMGGSKSAYVSRDTDLPCYIKAFAKQSQIQALGCLPLEELLQKSD